MRLAVLSVLAAATVTAVACGGATEVPVVDPFCNGKCDGLSSIPGIAEQRIYPQLSFEMPVGLQSMPGNAKQLVVTEHTGRVQAFNQKDGSGLRVLLDIRERVFLNPTGEAGLHGAAIDPQALDSLYVTYNAKAPRSSAAGELHNFWRLSRFRSHDGGGTYDAANEEILIELEKRADEHNGGELRFGPDGLLYISIGDGGPSFDPNKFAQNTFALYGKILRIDPRGRQDDAVEPAAQRTRFRFASDGTPGLTTHNVSGGVRRLDYKIPADNPFASTPDLGRPEIYAWGLRNPWRFSFDHTTGELWAGDVGQDAFEEIDRIVKGGNYGWSIKEGSHCGPNGAPCDVADLQPPIAELQHGPRMSAIIGGAVYRGKAMPSLAGVYVFANFAPGTYFGLFTDPQTKETVAQELSRSSLLITALSTDANGELYALDFRGGIYRLVPGPAHPPTDATATYKFLMRAGIGDEQSGVAYYQSIMPELDEKLAVAGKPFSLADWEARTFVDATIESYYQNALDLGFWREMKCTTTIGRGVGGCRVRNWRDEGDRNAAGTGNLGTVAMDVSPEGFTRFYVFGPDGNLTPIAILDHEGKKAAPQLCTVCHAGKYAGAGGDPDLGSIFREFEPSVLLRRAGVTAEAAEQELFALNQAVRSANAALRSEAEGSPVGVDSARANLEQYLVAMYAASPVDAPAALPIDSVEHLPPSWTAQPGESATLVRAKERVWTKLVNRYCMGCHRTNALDLTDYGNFLVLAANQSGKSVLERYMLDTPGDPVRETTLYMPQAELMYTTLQADSAAKAAAAQWALQASSPTAPTAVIDVQLDGQPNTVAGDTVAIVGNVSELGVWNTAQSVPLAGVLTDGQWKGRWVGQLVLPQGASVQWKAIVLNRFGQVREWEPDLPTASRNRELAVPQEDSARLVVTWGQP